MSEGRVITSIHLPKMTNEEDARIRNIGRHIKSPRMNRSMIKKNKRVSTGIKIQRKAHETMVETDRGVIIKKMIIQNCKQ